MLMLFCSDWCFLAQPWAALTAKADIQHQQFIERLINEHLSAAAGGLPGDEDMESVMSVSIVAI